MEQMLLSLGLYDDPSNQKQDRYEVDLYISNLAVFGSAMTGKTYLLKWILLNIHYLMKSSEDEEVYILDFSNNLSAFKKLPFVIGYFDSFNEENIRRVFKIVEERYINNVRELPGKNFLQRGDNTKVKHITFVLDGIHVLFADDRYQKYQERLFALARDGLSKGISVIFTATEPVNGIGKMLSSFDHKIAFAINPDSYSNIFFRKVDIPMNKPGRGVANGDGTFVYEFQAFLPYDISDKENSDESVIENMVSRLRQSEYFGDDAINRLLDKHLESIADTLSEKNWNEYVKANKEWKISDGRKIGKAGHLIAGIDYYLCTPIDINLKEAKTLAIYGKKDSGKTNLLKLILRGLLLSQQDNEHIRIVYWDDTRKGLMDPVSGVGNLLKQFIDTKQIESEEGLVKYLCEQHYCVLEQVEPEKVHTAKLISLPNQNRFTGKDVFSDNPVDDSIPLSDGRTDSDSYENDTTPAFSQNDEFSSLIINNNLDVNKFSEDVEELEDVVTVEEALEELPEIEIEAESVEELEDAATIEEALEELPESNLAIGHSDTRLKSDSNPIVFGNNSEIEVDSSCNYQKEIYDDTTEDDVKNIFDDYDDEADVISENGDEYSNYELELGKLNDEIVREDSSYFSTNNGSGNGSDEYYTNDNPFTVFIIQSRSFFVKAVDSQSHIITRLVNYISECENVLFVFSDTQSIQDFEVRYHFNNNIRYAFLFDDIVKYIQGKGSRSIFSQYDLDELKENFGRNEKGDAFFYDVLFENIQKIKVILDE